MRKLFEEAGFQLSETKKKVLIDMAAKEKYTKNAEFGTLKQCKDSYMELKLQVESLRKELKLKKEGGIGNPVYENYSMDGLL